MSLSVLMPWNPATTATEPFASVSRMRSPLTSRILALPCTVSVTIPAWEPGEAHRVDAEVDAGHAEQRHRDPLARGEQHVHLTAVRVVRHVVGEPHEVVGGLAHGRDDHHHLVARRCASARRDRRRPACGRGPRRTIRRTSGRSGPRRFEGTPRPPWRPDPFPMPARPESTVDFCHNAPFTWGEGTPRAQSSSCRSTDRRSGSSPPWRCATVRRRHRGPRGPGPTGRRRAALVDRRSGVDPGLVVRGSVHQVAVMHAPPGATAYLFGPDTFVSKTIDSLGSQMFRNVKSGCEVRRVGHRRRHEHRPGPDHRAQGADGPAAVALLRPAARGRQPQRHLRLRLPHDARRHAALGAGRAPRSARPGSVPRGDGVLGLRPVEPEHRPAAVRGDARRRAGTRGSASTSAAPAAPAARSTSSRTSRPSTATTRSRPSPRSRGRTDTSAWSASPTRASASCSSPAPNRRTSTRSRRCR